MTPGQLIAFLNAMSCGDLDSVGAKLEQGRGACLVLDLPELAGYLEEAGSALRSGDLRAFRKKVETVIARLGHVRAKI